MVQITENYRQFDFTRFVYQDAPKNPPPTDADNEKTEVKEEKKEGEKKEPVAPERRDVQAFNKNVDARIKKSGLETKLDDKDKAELQRIKDSYKTEVETVDAKYDTAIAKEKRDLNKVKQIHNELVVNFIQNQKAEHKGETGKTAEAKAPETAPAEPPKAKAEAKTEEKSEKAEEKPQNDPKEALVNALFLNNKFRQDMAPLLSPEASASPEAFRKAMMEKPEFNKAIENCMGEGGLSPESKRGLAEKGANYILTGPDKDIIGESFRKAFSLEKAERVNMDEVALINKQEVGVKGGKMPFEKVFGRDVAVALSINHKIEEVKDKDGKKSQMMIDGKASTDVAGDLINLLPKEMHDIYDKVKTMDEGAPRDALMKQLAEKGNTEGLTAERMSQVADILKSPDAVKGLKDMGPMELISTLIQLWSTINQALKDKDFNTLGDMMKDLQQGKNPAESMKQAENTYKQKINAMTDPNELLGLYTDPRGREATVKFGETPYRNMMKKAVQERMEDALDIKITKIEPEKGGTSTKISGEKDGRQYEISISKGQMKSEEVITTVDNDAAIRKSERDLGSKQKELADLEKVTPEEKDKANHQAKIDEIKKGITETEDKIDDLTAKNGKTDRRPDTKWGEEPGGAYIKLKGELVTSVTAEAPAEPEEPEKPKTEVAATEKKPEAGAPAPEAKPVEKPAAATETVQTGPVKTAAPAV